MFQVKTIRTVREIGDFNFQVRRFHVRVRVLIIIPSQQRWRGYSNAAVRGWLGE